MPEKRGCGRPVLHRVEQPAPIIPVEEPDVLNDINEILSTIYPVRKIQWNRQPLWPAQLIIVQPDAPLLFDEVQTAIKQIEAQNIQDNRTLTERTIPAQYRQHDIIPMVMEERHQVDMDRHFPRLHLLDSVYTKDLQIKTHRDVPNQKVIDKIVDQLNS